MTPTSLPKHRRRQELSKKGRFELANGATLFLDEIGELPLDLQPKLLRVLQDGEFERLGSSQTLRTDVRVIAATNRNLEEDVRKNIFVWTSGTGYKNSLSRDTQD